MFGVVETAASLDFHRTTMNFDFGSVLKFQKECCCINYTCVCVCACLQSTVSRFQVFHQKFLKLLTISNIIRFESRQTWIVGLLLGKRHLAVSARWHFDAFCFQTRLASTGVPPLFKFHCKSYMIHFGNSSLPTICIPGDLQSFVGISWLVGE